LVGVFCVGVVGGGLFLCMCVVVLLIGGLGLRF
jgi:hypothetical protein